MTDTDLARPSGRGNRERRAEHSRATGLCQFCRPGKGCNTTRNDRPRADRYKSQRKGR